MGPVRFTVAYWCVLAAALLPYACAYLAKSGGFGRPRSQGGYDNQDPRAWLGKLTDWRARANAAQANSFEALPFFIGAVVIAHQVAAPQTLVDILAVVFVTLRVVYIAMYVAGLPTIRSAIWALAFVVNVGILLAGLR
ncbi:MULTISPECIES: MAPEG family protein [Ramlibacter]|uniref:Glutathione metabolism protein n=1 Tax=Ramlibacter pinisoli TaxID=2682844 RepID=A0A6N8IYX9_9BURK|nr:MULTISPECIES: MAPEG family protein [Ramlibacter]MBA2961258.1 MAPEG family protein [Ramlibacter sp. CGMCC 1.13660]MVQ31203.1 glutathione metabolism protein [Ramlibacter pinisoli]